MTDVDLARKLITRQASYYNGSHYLWGADGTMPGHNDGTKRPLTVVKWEKTSLDPAQPSVFAAATDVPFDGHYVCAGRWRNITGGRRARADELEAYLDGLKGQDPALWKPYYTYFTPRKIQGKDVPDAGLIVWGEDCRFAQHFDCISFINYVLSNTTTQVSKQDKTGNRIMWTANIEQWVNTTTPVKLDDPVVPADLVFRGDRSNKLDPNSKITWTHIGLLHENGNVIQAEQASMGVHTDEKYVPGGWTARGRLPTSLLRPDAW
ncbi:MAG: hypothetical protein LAP13_16380 [Acidobacteriia bacterium]|nr:hypothetical protein [Terriglobia bacterium]